ncbi:MAG TPA: hypothetical protein K8V56_08810, partial [Sporosarcina psychrophila]|nr:hypothetical protein [Sporosarcina psychrophila]
MNTAYALYKGFWETTEKTTILGVNWNSCYYRFDALWMPSAISRKGEHFQSYRSGYHEDAPSLDGLFEKAYFGIGDETYNLA